MLVHRMQQAFENEVEPDWKEIEAAGSMALDLCQAMLKHDPQKRIRLPAALDHKWLEITIEAPMPLSSREVETLRRRLNHSSLRMSLLNSVASKLQGESLQYYRRSWENLIWTAQAPSPWTTSSLCCRISASTKQMRRSCIRLWTWMVGGRVIQRVCGCHLGPQHS